MSFKQTVWGYIDENGVEILDCKPNELGDHGKGINLMIKNSNYYISRIIPYILKNKDKRIHVINASLEEQALLFYLELDKVCGTLSWDFENDPMPIRTWLERKISPFPHLVNTLWMLDHKGLTPKPSKIDSKIPLTHNVSYSRPEILDFDRKVYKEFKPQNKSLAIVPCTQGKPYHKRKYKVDSTFTKISGKGKDVLQQYLNDETYDKIVLTSLGLIPREYWLYPVVLNYDTGTRDMWKLLCLCKRFFEKNQYEKYVVLVKFKPYRDIIRLLMDMGVIERDRVEFVGEDEKSNGLRIMFYPGEYKLYNEKKSNKRVN